MPVTRALGTLSFDWLAFAALGTLSFDWLAFPAKRVLVGSSSYLENCACVPNWLTGADLKPRAVRRKVKVQLLPLAL